MMKENKRGINSGFNSLCFRKELAEPFKAKQNPREDHQRAQMRA